MDKEHRLEKIHSLELMIAREMKRICEKHNIRYFLAYGSVLGAIRHKGFIPWDDDMDFGMPRVDFEKFLRIAPIELENNFYLQTWNIDEGFPFSYAKIRLKDTHIYEQFAADTSMNNGIFIDIFPFDNVPDNDALAYMRDRSLYIIKQLMWIKKGFGKNIPSQGFTSALKYFATKCIAFFIPYAFLKNRFITIEQKYNASTTARIAGGGPYSYKKESIPVAWISELKPVKFESDVFLTLNSPTDYLKHIYGDYMKLPPVEKRGGHEAVDIDFGPYIDKDKL